MILLNNGVKMTDYISIFRENPKTGERTLLLQEENVTITAYRARVMNRMSSVTAIDVISVTQMSWGTGVAPAASGDSDLAALLLTKGLNNTPLVSGDSIVYEGRLDLTEGNVSLREVGLKTSDNLLAARVNISIDKAPTEILVFTWTKSVIGT